MITIEFIHQIVHHIKKLLCLNQIKQLIYNLGIQSKLVDFKIEFGRYEGEIILIDEISPDTCRLWDMHTNEKLDKDRFRYDMGNVESAYEEVYRRLVL